MGKYRKREDYTYNPALGLKLDEDGSIVRCSESFDKHLDFTYRSLSLRHEKTAFIELHDSCDEAIRAFEALGITPRADLIVEAAFRMMDRVKELRDAERQDEE
jgi:hypothetical protein